MSVWGEGAGREIWVRNHAGGSCECVGGGGSRQRDLGEESRRRLVCVCVCGGGGGGGGGKGLVFKIDQRVPVVLVALVWGGPAPGPFPPPMNYMYVCSYCCKTIL